VLALENPFREDERVQIFHQMVKAHRIRDLAKMISEITGVEVAHLENPRKEAAENDLHVRNDFFLNLGLKPITLNQGLMQEVTEVARRYAHRCDVSKIPSTSLWTREQREASARLEQSLETVV